MHHSERSKSNPTYKRIGNYQGKFRRDTLSKEPVYMDNDVTKVTYESDGFQLIGLALEICKIFYLNFNFNM